MSREEKLLERLRDFRRDQGGILMNCAIYCNGLALK
jgi:hypothetical protein